MRLALKLGKSLQEMERMTATELSLWQGLDRQPAPPRPSSIKDFLATVKTRTA